VIAVRLQGAPVRTRQFANPSLPFSPYSSTVMLTFQQQVAPTESARPRFASSASHRPDAEKKFS
jgi:hypothetical protein